MTSRFANCSSCYFLSVLTGDDFSTLHKKVIAASWRESCKQHLDQSDAAHTCKELEEE